MHSFFAPPIRQKMGIVFLLSALPLALLLQSHWLIRGTGDQICEYRALARKVATVLPNHARLAVIDPETGGFFGYVDNFEFAVNETRDHSVAMTQNISVPHDMSLPDIHQQFPKTDAVDAVLIEGQTPVLFVPKDQEWKPAAF
jgi:hypothetical protein